ncbi:MAG: cadherin-like domain-containing protein [Verrucomicrobiales bacterium]
MTGRSTAETRRRNSPSSGTAPARSARRCAGPIRRARRSAGWTTPPPRWSTTSTCASPDPAGRRPICHSCSTPPNPAALATAGDNVVDNVEQVLIRAAPGAAGTYTVSVSHKGALSSGSQTFSLIVSGRGGSVNSPPIIAANTLAISEGGTVTLNAAALAATDADHPQSDLTFTASNIAHGRFLVGGVEATSFTPAQVGAGQVRFQHDGSESAPGYDASWRAIRWTAPRRRRGGQETLFQRDRQSGPARRLGRAVGGEHPGIARRNRPRMARAAHRRRRRGKLLSLSPRRRQRRCTAGHRVGDPAVVGAPATQTRR